MRPRALLCLVSICGLAAGPVPAIADTADGFCAQLRAAVKDAEAGFPRLRGASLGLVWDDGGGDDQTRYAATRALPGALRCEVDRGHADGEDVISTFVCAFAATPDKAAAVRRMAAQIQACIGARAADQLTFGAGDTVAAFDVDRAGYVLEVDAGAAPPVMLMLNAK